MWKRGSGIIVQAEILVVATGDFRDEVKNLGLQVTSEGDVFRTGGSSGMTLSDGACREGNVYGILT